MGSSTGGFDNAIYQANMEAMQKAAAEAAAMPKRPEFNSLLDPDTGVMKSQYLNQYGSDILPNTQGIEEIRNRALSTGPSAWANAATTAQGLDEQRLRDATQQQAASANSEQQSNLASKYGLSRGAQERLAIQSQRDKMAGLQNVGFQGSQARANIGLQDQGMKNQFLSNLPGQENALAGATLANRNASLGQQNFNTTNAITQASLKNAADLNAYNKQMEVYSANKNANAMQSQGGGGKK